jgi:hypothetical protein
VGFRAVVLKIDKDTSQILGISARSRPISTIAAK